MDDLFSAWPIVAKAMSHKEKTLVVSQLMADKTAQDISFTAIDSEGELSQYVLGTVEGNMAFLLGKGNAGFHFAPYHIQIMDPSVSEEMAKNIYDAKGHPSILAFWAAAGQAPFTEGDVKEGKPHPDAIVLPKQDNVFKFSFRGKKYEANPDTQLVTCVTTDHTYAWALVQNTYLASQIPELALTMEPLPEIEKKLPYPEPLKILVNAVKGKRYNEEVYPLVKSQFPKPGTVINVGEHFAVFCPNSVIVFDKEGETTPLQLWDTTNYSGRLDLHKGGSTFPCAIINFAKEYLAMDVSSIEKFI